MLKPKEINMLEIRRGTAAKNYENTFFREFATNLEKFFTKYSIDGLLIANSGCDEEKRLQIDALLITNNVVCIIDFKNFGGKIKLPGNAKSEFEFGKWTNENGEIVKGGNSINPFIQLKKQKERFVNVCQHITPNLFSGDKFNSLHTVKMVCFQKPIELIGSIPSHEELNFFIIDKNNYLEKIKDVIDITDKEVKLSQNSFSLFKEIFKANKFDITESYEEKVISDNYSKELDFDSLYPDQKSALQKINEFIKSDSDEIFILQGSSLSGKSHLIPFIEDIAYNNKISQVEIFASSSRVATNLLSESQLKFNSIYSHIYGGSLQDFQNDNENQINELEIVPLKENDNEDKAIFIVDEAQLVSDNYNQSIDLRFGSGKLLADFIAFSDLKNSHRKIIFVGDSFQLAIGKKDESPLNSIYLKAKYKLEAKSFQLIDKENRSSIIREALKAVNGLRSQSFNQLSFEVSDNLKLLEKEDILPIIKNRILNKIDFHLLSYSNADAQKINYWIKKVIIRNGDDMESKDLIIFNNNFKVENENDPFIESQKVFNGQFGTVTNVDNNIISETVTPNGKSPITLNFREVSIMLKNTGHNVTILSLENYRLSKKGELSEDEIIALKIILNKEIKNELDNNPFEKSETFNEILRSNEYKELEQRIILLKKQLDNGNKVKVELQETERTKGKIEKSAKRKHRKIFELKLNKDTSSKYYKYKNAARLRFAWALTVHKSMFYKWDEVLFNVEQGENRGKTNEDYFKWIYTGLTRAKKEVKLINYEGINPFFKMEFKDANTGTKPDKKIYFIANPDIIMSDTETSFNNKFDFPDSKPQLLQLFQLLQSKLKPHGINISSINHPNYQEIYKLTGSDGEVANISFYYNNKWQIKAPTLIKSEPKEFGDKVISVLYEENVLNDFIFVKDKWRENIYTNLNQLLNKNGNFFNYIIQTPFKDTVKIIGDNSELIIDMYYDGDGFYSSIIATYYSDDKIWEEVKIILNNLKGE